MMRPVLASMLIVCYLAGQVAAVPHAHDRVPAGHHHRSHVHVGWLLDWLGAEPTSDRHHDHRHSHGATEHRHSHEKLPPHHDEDSIDVPTLVAIGHRDAGPQDQAEGLVELLPNSTVGCEHFSLEAARARALIDAQCDELGSGCALYLTLRTLRI